MRKERGQGQTVGQRKKGNFVLMTSGMENRFHRVNQEVIMSTLCLCDTCAQAALPWFPMWWYNTLPWAPNLPPFSLATPLLAGTPVSSSSISCSSLARKHTQKKSVDHSWPQIVLYLSKLWVQIKTPLNHTATATPGFLNIVAIYRLISK